MRHHAHNRILSRTRRARVALLRGLAISLIARGQVRTTEAKAKELRPFVERLVTIAKKDSVTARRIIASRLGEPTGAAVQGLFSKASEYADRPGGYTRVVKCGLTPAGRLEAIIELV